MNRFLSFYIFLLFGLLMPVVLSSQSETSATAIAIQQQPESISICAGSSSSFSVTASGNNIGYQWQVNEGRGFRNIKPSESNYSGITSPVMQIATLRKGMNQWAFRCLLTSGTGVLRSRASEILLEDVVINQQPSDGTASKGQYHSYLVEASGLNTQYQWQVDTGTGFVDVQDNQSYSGSQEKLLSILAAEEAMHQNQYRCIIKGDGCSGLESLISEPAKLIVTAAPAALLAGINPDPSSTIFYSKNLRTVMIGNPILYVDGAIEVEGTTGGVLPPGFFHSYDDCDLYLTGDINNNADSDAALFTRSGQNISAESDNTKVIMCGNNLQTIRGSSDSTNFFHLQIKKDNFDELVRLEAPMSIRNILEFGTGSLDLNNRDVELNYRLAVLTVANLDQFPKIFNESDDHRIFDGASSVAGGKVFFSQGLDNSFASYTSPLNLGNLGAEIQTSGLELGAAILTINRGHYPYDLGINNPEAIQRYYEIESTNPLSLDMNFTFHYLEGATSDIFGVGDESILELWRKPISGPGGFVSKGVTSNDAVANTVSLNAIDDLQGLWTLANCTNPPEVEIAEGEKLDLCIAQDSLVTTATLAGIPDYYVWEWNGLSQAPETTGSYTILSENLKGGSLADTLVVYAYDVSECYGTDTLIIVQEAIPALEILSSLPILNETVFPCIGQAVLLSDATPGVTYSWTLNGGEVSTEANYIYTDNVGISQEVIMNVSTTSLGCLFSDTIAISSIPLPIIDLGEDTTFCLIPNEIILNADQGPGNFNYQWTNESTNTSLGTTSQIDFAPISTGTEVAISVRVENQFNTACSNTDTIVLSASFGLELVFKDSTDVSCVGGADGVASIFSQGGNGGNPSGSYSYLWNTGATGRLIDNLFAGTYLVTVTDEYGCTASDSVMVNDPAPPIWAVIDSIEQIKCFGEQNGSINLTIDVLDVNDSDFVVLEWATTNGSGLDLITYSPSSQSGLGVGTYSVTITNVSGIGGCYELDFMISQPSEPLAVELVKTQVTCFGGMDGSLSLNPSGGVPPYTYLWNTGETTQSINNLVAGIYEYTVFDANDCSYFESSISVDQPFELLDEAACTFTRDILCSGDSTGLVSWGDLGCFSGGTTPYKFLWNNGKTTPIIDSLPVGDYWCILTDSLGCTLFSDTFKIMEPSPLILTNVATQNTTCGGSTIGSIAITISGGTPPYTYLWSNGGMSNAISNLIAGPYKCTITDAVACTFETDNIVINLLGSDLMISAETPSPVSCFGGNDGSIELTVSGMGTPYSYLWSTGAISPGLSNLSIGFYTCTVTDVVGCSIASSAIEVTQSDLLVSQMSTFNVACFGESTGSASASITGGTEPYTYAWSNMGNTSSIANLDIGIYYLTLTDAKGCVLLDSAEIFQPTAPVAILATIDSLNCFEDGSGAIDLQISGGTGTYNIDWNNGQSGTPIIDLAAGTYTASVTDANSCLLIENFEVLEPELLMGEAIAMNISCFGEADGSLDLSITGGTSPYSVNWNSGETTLFISALAKGIHTATITDAKGCSVIENFEIIEPDSLAIENAIQIAGCKTDEDGYINITTFGGSEPYTFSWDNGTTSEDPYNLTAGEYRLTLTDFNGCSLSENFEVGQSPTRYEASFLVASGLLVLNVDTVRVLSSEEVQFVDVSFPDPISWYWEYGDMNDSTSTVYNPLFSYPYVSTQPQSFYEARLISSNAFCTDTITKTLLITNNRAVPSVGEPVDSLAYLNFEKVSLYPNPTLGAIQLDIALTRPYAVDLQVVSESGQLLQESTYADQRFYEVALDLSDLSSGTYFIFLKSLNRTYALKVVKVE